MEEHSTVAADMCCVYCTGVSSCIATYMSDEVGIYVMVAFCIVFLMVAFYKGTVQSHLICNQ